MLAPAEKESKTADKNFKLCIQMFVNGVAKKISGRILFVHWSDTIFKMVKKRYICVFNASLLLEIIFTKTKFCNDNKVRQRRQRQSNFKVFYLAGCFTD